MFKTDFGLVIHAAGISNKDLANHLEITQQQVCDWVIGHRPIPEKYINKISDYLQWDLTEQLADNDRILILNTMLSKYFGKQVKIEFPIHSKP